MLKKFEDLLNLNDRFLDEILESYVNTPLIFTQEERTVIEAFLALAED